MLNEFNSWAFSSSPFVVVMPWTYTSRFDIFDPAAVAVVMVPVVPDIPVAKSDFRPMFQVIVRVACWV